MSITTETSSKSPEQGSAGSRLAFLSGFSSPRVFQKDFYLSGLKGGMLTFLGVLSILTLYMMIAFVSIANAVHYFRARRASKASAPSPPSDFEPEAKPSQEVGLNMDDVQEIPGEIEFFAMKEVMPADDQIPDIDEQQQDAGSSDEHELSHNVLSDDERTLVGPEDLVAIKGSPVIVPSVPTIKEDFERPISPPATPPTAPAEVESPTVDVVDVLQSAPKSENPVVEIVSDKPLQEPSSLEDALDKTADVTANTVAAAVKAVEEHAKIVEDAASPTESAGVSPKPSEDSPISEPVVVPSEVVEEPIKGVEAVSVSSVTDTKEAIAEPGVVDLPPAPMPVPEVVEAEVVLAKPEVVPEATTTDLVSEPEPIEAAPALEAPKLAEEPKPIQVEGPIKEPKVVEEPKEIEELKPIETPKPVEAPRPIEETRIVQPAARKPSPTRESSPLPPKSLGRPSVMRRATGSTSAIAGVTTSPAPATVAATVDDKASVRNKALRRADDALNMLAGSLLRSNTIDRLPRSESPKPSGIPRPASPANMQRSASPVTVPRSESPSSDVSGSPPASMSRRGSIAIARPPSRQSALANVTNASTFSNRPRGGSVSPPPMPLPPQRQGSQGTVSNGLQRQGSVRGSPQVPQAAVMSPSVLSRKATIDSNGSPGSPPVPVARRPTSPAPAAPPRPATPAEEFTTSANTKRNVPFPSAPDGGNQPVASLNAVRPRPRPRTSTSGNTTAPTAPNSLLATLGAKVAFPTSNSNSNPNSNPNTHVAGPARSDSIASAVSNRGSILSFSDMSDMDASIPDLDFPSGQGLRMGLGTRYDSVGSMSSDGMSGDDEEKRKKRAKRRAKARAQSLKKQKRSKRN